MGKGTVRGPGTWDNDPERAVLAGRGVSGTRSSRCTGGGEAGHVPQAATCCLPARSLLPPHLFSLGMCHSDGKQFTMRRWPGGSGRFAWGQRADSKRVGGPGDSHPKARTWSALHH